MKINEAYPSHFLKAEDIDDEITLTITRSEIAELKDKDGQNVQKPVLYFKEAQKGLIVNKTNFKLISESTGEEDSDNWIGKKITLYTLDVDAFGDVVSAIRVKKVTLSRTALMKQYQGLFEKAKALKVEGLSDFEISADADEATIIDTGKQLRELISAAEAFA